MQLTIFETKCIITQIIHWHNIAFIKVQYDNIKFYDNEESKHKEKGIIGSLLQNVG